jgi:glycosyltransferase involved in cell wall biosynthesis
VSGTKADIYHAHEENALVATYVASRLQRKQLVFDAHELPLVDPHVTRWRTLVRIARGVLRVLTRGAQATITVSPPIGPKIQEMYGGPPAVIVRNLPPFRTVARTNRLREYFGLPESIRIALYQGNLAPDRSLDKLIYAAHTLPENVVIVILGRGPSQEPLKRLIAEEGVESRVLMAPFVPYQELLSWTASADLGLILYNPDFSENVRMCLPNKLFEYTMVGLPVLASPLVAVNEIMDHYRFGRVVRQFDPASFGREIGAMANDTDALAEMRRNALTAAHEQLNWEVERRTLVGLYDRLTAERAARTQQRKA